ncbi:MAG: hypothetical protein Fur005_31140 [Roseiflexaceae bacterium]
MDLHDRAFVLERLVYDAPFQQLAQCDAAPINTLKSRVNRARQALKNRAIDEEAAFERAMQAPVLRY